MSHKLFTPLTVLQGKLMLWKDGLLGSLDEKQMKHVNSMADQTAKLNDLIGSLVNFVSMEENKFDTSREELDLGKTLNEVAERCRQWFADKNPIVDIKVEEGAGKFTFNKKLFEVMTSQLIENGLKFNLSVPPRVQVNCRRIGKETVIGIIDNGVGIPREYHEKIFEKFYQIEKYYTGNVEGVGLGLAYVKKIVEAFGGRIEVSSEPGKGSVFTLKFTT
jgi:signal transduction histidine kinase